MQKEHESNQENRHEEKSSSGKQINRKEVETNRRRGEQGMWKELEVRGLQLSEQGMWEELEVRGLHLSEQGMWKELEVRRLHLSEQGMWEELEVRGETPTIKTRNVGRA